MIYRNHSANLSASWTRGITIGSSKQEKISQVCIRNNNARYNTKINLYDERNICGRHSESPRHIIGEHVATHKQACNLHFGGPTLPPRAQRGRIWLVGMPWSKIRWPRTHSPQSWCHSRVRWHDIKLYHIITIHGGSFTTADLGRGGRANKEKLPKKGVIELWG
jgi:hypothetical protein